MTKITIFFGDVTDQTALRAWQFDDTAVCLNLENYKDFLYDRLPYRTFYTSLGDLSGVGDLIYSILLKADDIYYCSVNQWSDNKDIDYDNITESIRGLTESILYAISRLKNNVHSLDLSHYLEKNFLELADQRHSESPQLWVAGGSDTHGCGIGDNERYGELLAQMLNRKVSFLSWPNASIEWMADQIIRSDIRAGDIVIFSLVPDNRYPFYDDKDKKVLHSSISSPSSQHKNLDIKHSTVVNFLASKNLLHKNVVTIHQIINFCRKAKAQLLILGLLCSNEIAMQLSDVKEFQNYIHIDSNHVYLKRYVDYASDNRHPGPIQHRMYAEFCQTSLKKLNYM